MTIGSQENTLISIKNLAIEARRDLGQNADRGTTARPTVAQINRTLERLASIETILDIVIDAMPAEIKHASHKECVIVGRLVRDLLKAGHRLAVWDGGAFCTKSTADAEIIFDALASTDSDHIHIYDEGGIPGRNESKGWVYLVWGNESDVISDYTTNLEVLVAPSNELADKLAGE